MTHPLRLAAVAIVALAACGRPKPAAMPPSAQHPLLGRPFPAFKRPALSGETVDSASAKGSVLVVKLFAKYCEPCKKTLPAAEKLHRELPQVRFIGIAEDDSRAAAEAVVSEYQLTFPVVMDSGNVLSGRLRVSDLPVTFVVGADGGIRWVGGPDQAESALSDAVQTVLSNP